jgi:RNA polymerase sigma-70 factor (ECF subfamily)
VQPERFERLYSEHAAPLLRYLIMQAGDEQLAEDVLADTFERALRARRRFDPRRGSEKTWLYSIARNCLLDRHRRSGAEARALERAGTGGQSSGSTGVEAVESRDAVQRAMVTLSAEEREAIALRYGADLTVPELARVLDEPLTTMEGRVYRALRKLRDELD